MVLTSPHCRSPLVPLTSPPLLDCGSPLVPRWVIEGDGCMRVKIDQSGDGIHVHVHSYCGDGSIKAAMEHMYNTVTCTTTHVHVHSSPCMLDDD